MAGIPPFEETAMSTTRAFRPVALASAAGLALAGSASAQITNGNFETGNLSGWTVASGSPAPIASTSAPHGGAYSLQLGSISGETPGDSAVYQNFTVPSTGLALSFWYRTSTVDSITYDWQDAYIQNSSGTTLSTIFHTCQTSGWAQVVVDLNPYVGQTIRLKFLVHGDNAGDPTSMYIDDVAVGPAPVMGSCCRGISQGCIITTTSSCTSFGGTYNGDNTTCATANCPGYTSGADVIVGEVYDISYDGAVGSISAYSIGTDSCNVGTAGVPWQSSTNQHPVIVGNMFRLKTVSGADRFEQIGLSWFKNGFLATNDDFCGVCGTASGSALGPGGCSDVYTSGLNGDQGNMGPRSVVNATSAAFPYPYTLGWNTTGNAIFKRCQVFTSDIDPAQNAGARYFADAHYVAPGDSTYVSGGGTATNGLNNVSYRKILIPGVTSAPTFDGLSHQESPGILAWRDQDASVTNVNADYTDSTSGTPIVSRFIVASKATSLGGGQYHYEYAIYNVNADRSGGSFSVPIPAGAVVTNVGFHAPFYHSGEVYDNTAWNSSVSGSAVTWTPAPFSPAANANALRWGTLYNFRFDANVAPGTGSATLGLFKTGSPASLAVAGLPVPGTSCYANCDNSTASPILNVADFSCFLTRYAAQDPYANCDNSTAIPTLNVADFSCFLTKYAAGCP
jgi:hypothetical protein